MKKALPVLYCIVLILSACSSNELSRKKAQELIQSTYKYPTVIDFDIFTQDEGQYRKFDESHLQDSGLFTLHRWRSLYDVGKPIVVFTDKAKPYFLPAEEKQIASVQKVKVADEEFIEITGLRLGSNEKVALVEYTTEYKNLTPFSVLSRINFNKKPVTRHAYFALYDDGWRIEKKPGIEFIEFGR